MKATVAIPLLFSVVSFVLTLLALLAGQTKGFMEDYSVMMFNTSTLGQNFIENLGGLGGGSSSTASSSTTSATPTPTDKGILGGIGDGIGSIAASATSALGSRESEAVGILNDLGNDVADGLSSALGIEQFYSFHVTNLCQGDYAPNATASGSWLNTTACTTPMDFSALDISTLLNKSLSLGPFDISLSDLGFTSKMTNKLSSLPSIVEALAAMYILSAVFAGLSMLAAATSLFLIPRWGGRRIVLANFLLALPAAVFLFVGSLLYTVGAAKVVSRLQDLGADDIGLRVTVGSKFEGLTWAAFALMLLAAAYWLWEFVALVRTSRRERRARRERGEKYSMESGRDGKFAGNR